MKVARKKFKRWTSRDVTLFAIACLGIAFLAVFSYTPMFGVVLAFKDGNEVLNVFRAIFMSDWVGFDNFKEFILDPKFVDVILNTLGLNLIMLCINFPAPILFAILLNEVQHSKYKKTIQTISTFPHFVSWVIFGGIVISLTDMTTGIFNPILYALGIGSPNDPINLQTAEYFWATMIITSLIKGVGWGSIIYLAAIAGISPELYEAATIDGANRGQQAWHITLPLIAPTITVFLLLNVSNLLSNSFDQFYVFQNSANLKRSEVLATYIYKTGIIQRQYSYTSALGLFESLVSVVLLVISNILSKRVSGRGIFS